MNLEGKLLQILTTFPEKYFFIYLAFSNFQQKNRELSKLESCLPLVTNISLRRKCISL